MKKSLVLLLILTMVLSAFLVGCTPKETEAPPATQAPATSAAATEAPVVVEEPSGLLTVGITEASGNFNPMYYSSAYDGYVVDMVFEGLIYRNFEGEFEGNIADSWEYSNDNKTITFKMKNDVLFSDGQPLTAHDVVFSYLILADPSYTGRYSSTVKDMVGYAAYYAGETDVFEGVVALDDYTVQFNFNEALRPNFANCGAAIMPKHYYGADFTPGNTASIETMTSAPIGSGPYVVDMFREKELVYLKRNMNYTRPGYMVAEIILKFVDMTTDIVELTSGNVDLLAGMIEPKKIAEARNGGFTLNSYNRSGYGYVKTNHEFGPTADKLVRQALFTAFNTEEFVNSYFYDAETDTVLAKTQFHPFSQISWAVTPEVLAQLTDYTFNLTKLNHFLTKLVGFLEQTAFALKMVK
jgi:peptide/nickel transport system substrate-binding protein